MRVAVNDASDPRVPQSDTDRLRRDVHDVHRLDRLRGVARHARALRDRDPFGHCFRQESALEIGLSHHRAKLLIGDVACAPRIAVRQQRGRARNVGDDRIGQQRCAGRNCEIVTQQRIAIAVHQEHALAGARGSRQRVDHRLRRRRSIVADPEFKQVSQDHELAVPRRIGLHETQEAFQRRRAFRRQMQVGNEDRIDQRLDRLRDRECGRRIY